MCGPGGVLVMGFKWDHTICFPASAGPAGLLLGDAKTALFLHRGAAASCAAADGRDNEAHGLDEGHGRSLPQSTGLY